MLNYARIKKKSIGCCLHSPAINTLLFSCDYRCHPPINIELFDLKAGF